jgi:hypothetical protein
MAEDYRFPRWSLAGGLFWPLDLRLFQNDSPISELMTARRETGLAVTRPSPASPSAPSGQAATPCATRRRSLERSRGPVCGRLARVRLIAPAADGSTRRFSLRPLWPRGRQRTGLYERPTASLCRSRGATTCTTTEDDGSVMAVVRVGRWITMGLEPSACFFWLGCTPGLKLKASCLCSGVPDQRGAGAGRRPALVRSSR